MQPQRQTVTLGTLEEVIRRFDSFIDVHQLYSYALPLLTQVPKVWSTEKASLRQQSLYVGAHWCQIVAADVQHLLPQGQQLVADSSAAAARLASRVKAGHDVHPIDPDFPSYVTSRWHDGAAKLAYRLGDHTQSRIWGKTSLELVALGDLIRCRADIISNNVRNVAEEVRQVSGGRSDVAEIYQEEISKGWAAVGVGELREEVERRQPIGPLVQRIVRKLSDQQREALRGICSLLHNQSTDVGAGGDSAARLRLSKMSELIAFALEDSYRLGQAMHQQAMICKDSDPEFAAKLWRHIVSNIRWVRGTLMARQQLALLSKGSSFATLNHALEQLFDLIDDIQARQLGSFNSGDALDVDLYGWTVKAAYGLTEQLAATSEAMADPAAVEVVKSRMMQELTEMIGAYRRVVKVATYKHAFGKYFSWAYDRLTAFYFKSQNLPKAFYWSEASTARDILDIIASSVEGESEHIPALSTDIAAAPSMGHDLHDLPTKFRMRFCMREDADPSSQIRRAVFASYERFEKYTQDHPLNAATIPTDIFDTTLNFSKCNSEIVLLRFVVERRTGENAETFGVFRFFQGQCTYIANLSIRESLERLAKLLALDTSHAAPSEDRQAQYRFCLAELSRSIGEEVIDPTLADVITNDVAPTIVFVPADSMFRLPLHLGCFGGGKLLAVRCPTVYSPTVSGLVLHGRLGCATVRGGANDVMGVISTPERENVLGEAEALEPLLTSAANASRVFFTGPQNIRSKFGTFDYLGRSTVDNLRKCLERDPQWLLISAHGKYVTDDKAKRIVHSYLSLPDDPTGIATPYDIAVSAARMKRNRLTMLAACVTGFGADLDGGEVSGFLRAMTVAGAGACALTLWPVEEHAVSVIIRHTIVELFKQGKDAYLPGYFREIYEEVYRYGVTQGWEGGAAESYCCFALYV